MLSPSLVASCAKATPHFPIMLGARTTHTRDRKTNVKISGNKPLSPDGLEPVRGVCSTCPGPPCKGGGDKKRECRSPHELQNGLATGVMRETLPGQRKRSIPFRDAAVKRIVTFAHHGQARSANTCIAPKTMRKWVKQGETPFSYICTPCPSSAATRVAA